MKSLIFRDLCVLGVGLILLWVGLNLLEIAEYQQSPPLRWGFFISGGGLVIAILVGMVAVAFSSFRRWKDEKKGRGTL